MDPPPKKILKVFDQDGLYKTMVVEPRTTAGEVCDKFAKKLFINENEIVQFSLFIFEGGVRQQLKATDFPYEWLVRYEKKDFRFCFLNPKGEFISFQEKVASSLTSNITKGNGTSATTNGSSNGPPSKNPPMPIKPGKGMSGYLHRKKATRFEKIWAVSKDKYLRIYPSEEDTTPTYELSLENAVIELKSGVQNTIVLTLSNSERHTFACDHDSELQQWAIELQCTTAYTASQSMKIATPAIPFIPTTRDLNIKLQTKLENLETQGKTFIKWASYILSGKEIVVGDDPLTAFSDGFVLINLIENLFDKTLRYRKGKSIYEMQYNVDACLDTLKDLGADFGKMISQDIVECKVSKVMLRLLWSLFITFVTNGEKEYVAKEKIVGWCGRKTLEFNKSIIVDSPSSLQNPLAFAAIIARYHPGMIDFASVSSKKSREEQAKIIIDVAHSQLGIPKIVEPSFWQEEQCDERSFLLYLSFYYFTLSGESQDKARIIKSCTEARSAVEAENTTSARDKQIQAQKAKHDEDRKRREEEEKAARLEKEEQERKVREEQEAARLLKENQEREEKEAEERKQREEQERKKREKEAEERERKRKEDEKEKEIEKQRSIQKQKDDELLRLKREEEEEIERFKQKMERINREKDEAKKLAAQNQLDDEKESDDDDDDEIEISNEPPVKAFEYEEEDDDEEDNGIFKNNSNTNNNRNSLETPQSPDVNSDIVKEYQNRKFTKPLPVPQKPAPQPQQSQQQNDDLQQQDTIDSNNSNDDELTTTTNNNNNNADGASVSGKKQGRVVVRICLEGFGEVLFCSFAIEHDTMCGLVRQMVIKKMKVPPEEEEEYALHIVRDGLERVLDDDELLLEAEDKIDRFVFKKNEIDRRYLISNHRG
eukprot:gene4290-5365_t